jgi:CBS domain-containing protein
MPQSIQEVMTKDPITLDAGASIREAAQRMKESDIGDVIVLEQDAICGIVTDRDIVVRAIAEGQDPDTAKLGEFCSRDIATLSPQDTVADAVQLMRQKAVRRIPVVENDRPVGIVSIGDLAIERDPESVLADISEARADD